MRTSAALHLVPSTLALFAAASGAQAQSPAPPERPAYAILRQNEDWSRFDAGDAPEDLFDRVKHMKLSADGGVWASFGGYERRRARAVLGYLFSADE